MALIKSCLANAGKEVKEVLSIGNIVGTGNYVMFSSPSLVTCAASNATQTTAIDTASEYFTISPYGVTSFKKDCHGVIMYQATSGGAVTVTEQDFTQGTSQILISAQSANESGVLYIYE